MFQLAKTGTLFGLLCFSPSILVACAIINRVNLAFKTILIKYTHLTLVVIPFKVAANNSLIFQPLQTYKKKSPSFRSFTVYNNSLLTITRTVLGNLGFFCSFVSEDCNFFPDGHATSNTITQTIYPQRSLFKFFTPSLLRKVTIK